MSSTINNQQLETATLGGGCFWCLDALYNRVPGIQSITSGYAGGSLPNPTYEQVCSGTTGHAEVIQITFDPSKISYEQILKIFWQAHDPTTLNRQGADEGPQYRSIILYQNEEQHQIAEKSKSQAQKNFRAPIVTEIAPLKTFYHAEDHHQQFLQKNPNHPYSQQVIQPKLNHLNPTINTGLSNLFF